MSRGIVGPFETRKPGISYLCLRGGIEKTAGLTVYEPDEGVVHFARWTPCGQNVVSRSAVQPPAREDDLAGRVVAADTIARYGKKVSFPLAAPLNDHGSAVDDHDQQGGMAKPLILSQYLIGPGLVPNVYPNRKQRKQRKACGPISPSPPASIVGSSGTFDGPCSISIG